MEPDTNKSRKLPIPPDKVTLLQTSTNTRSDTIRTVDDLNAYLHAMFEEPNYVHYIFRVDGTHNELLRSAFEQGILEFVESERNFYVLKHGTDNFVQIQPRLIRHEWEQKLVDEGPSYDRVRVRLGAKVFREFDVRYRLQLEASIRAKERTQNGDDGKAATQPWEDDRRHQLTEAETTILKALEGTSLTIPLLAKRSGYSEAALKKRGDTGFWRLREWGWVRRRGGRGGFFRADKPPVELTSATSGGLPKADQE